MTWKPEQTFPSSAHARGRNGFAAEDAWNGDVYLTGVIGTMALNLRDHGSAYPDSLTLDEWKDILTKIGEPLVAYATAKTQDPNSVNPGLARDALRLFAEWFDHFWD